MRLLIFLRKFYSLSIAGLIFLAACTSGNTPSGQQGPTSTPFPTAPAVARPTYTVQRGTVQTELTFTGRWQPRDQMKLSFPINGTIRQVNVTRGDQVAAGQLLADYQIDDLENQLANAQLELESAQANLTSGSEGTVQTVEDAQINLANAQLSLDSAKASRAWTSVASARLGVDNAQRALDNAQRSYDDIISRADSSASAVNNAYEALQNAQSSLQSAWYSYYSAAQQYNNGEFNIAQLENALTRAQLELERAQSGGSSTNEQQTLRSVQLQIDQLNAQIAQSSLYAPISGVVQEVTIQPGDQVDAFNAVITIGLPDPKEVIASLAFSDTQQLNIGQVGVCQILNQPETAVQCAVRQIPLTARDAEQTTRVAASLDNAELNQLVEVNMPLEVRENVLWLPPAAIRTFQNRIFVVLDTPDGPRSVDITLGLQTDERVEIISGLNEGDIVVGP